jgi:pimeloyl-ACP methyl ester carboxylesterase
MNTSNELNPARFATHRMVVCDNVELAYVREGIGGVPLLLVHGWPETKRLYWRNIAALAQAGFEVIVPDQRGIGESPVPDDPGDYVNAVASSRDLRALLAALGHKRVVLVGGDWGCAVVQDMSLRFPGLAIRQVVFNGISPVLPEAYAQHGITGEQHAEVAEISDHAVDNGLYTEQLVTALNTPEKRRDYIASFFLGGEYKPGSGVAHLAAPGSFDESSAAFHTQPFADAAHFRASLGYYEALMRPQPGGEVPRLSETSQIETLILYGIKDQVVGPKFPERMAVACLHHVGPFLINAGHFVQWEQADTFNGAVISFCRDLL